MKILKKEISNFFKFFFLSKFFLTFLLLGQESLDMRVVIYLMSYGKSRLRGFEDKNIQILFLFFQEWEGWSLLDSSYFCFITLTTIGFGDLVPDQNDTDGEIRIALNALYLLFGIALICMSFNLVQEEVIKNVKGFAMQLGLIQDPDDEEE